jgi:hypothetical protein
VTVSQRTDDEWNKLVGDDTLTEGLTSFREQLAPTKLRTILPSKQLTQATWEELEITSHYIKTLL